MAGVILTTSKEHRTPDVHQVHHWVLADRQALRDVATGWKPIIAGLVCVVVDRARRILTACRYDGTRYQVCTPCM
jgi:hypothetical protein